MSNDKLSPPKKFRSNWSIEKLHETNIQVIKIVIRCDLEYIYSHLISKNWEMKYPGSANVVPFFHRWRKYPAIWVYISELIKILIFKGKKFSNEFSLCNKNEWAFSQNFKTFQNPFSFEKK